MINLIRVVPGLLCALFLVESIVAQEGETNVSVDNQAAASGDGYCDMRTKYGSDGHVEVRITHVLMRNGVPLMTVEENPVSSGTPPISGLSTYRAYFKDGNGNSIIQPGDTVETKVKYISAGGGATNISRSNTVQ